VIQTRRSVMPSGNAPAKRSCNASGSASPSNSIRTRSVSHAMPTERGSGRLTFGRGLNPFEKATGDPLRTSALEKQSINSWCERNRNGPPSENSP